MNIDLSRFSKANPEAAIHLEGVDAESLQWIDSDDNLNLCDLTEDPPSYFHREESPLNEAKEAFQKIPLGGKEVLYVFGIGLGYLYQAAKSWLKEDKRRRLIFLEHDLRVLKRLFETPLGAEILADFQTSVYVFKRTIENEPLFGWLAWSSVEKQIEVAALPSYLARYSELYDHLKRHIFFEAAQKNEIVDEYQKFGIVFYRNFYKNVWMLPWSLQGKSLFGKFENRPAIICGAGPSLKRNLDELSSLTDKALIFAGGSALNALKSKGITPHFGAGVDPNPTQYYRLLGTSSVKVPFFYRLRMQSEALREVKGSLLYINGAGGYDTAEWLEEKLGIEGEVVDEGHNVVNFCAEIAHAMGCNPIIFVGLDLAYTDLKQYAEGVIENPEVDKSTLFHPTDFALSAVEAKDIHGEAVYTFWKWIAESDWISRFAKEHPEKIVLNATEGGIGFEGVPNMTLKEVSEEFMPRAYPFKSQIEDYLKGSEMPVTKEQIEDCLQELKESLLNCEEQLQILLQESDRMHEKVLRENIEPESLQSGLAALAEIELTESVAYQAILDMFNTIYTHVLQHEVQESSHLQGTSKILKLLELMDRKYNYLLHVVKANLLLLEEGLNLKDQA